MKMKKLNVNFAGLELKNPFIIGSGPASTHIGAIRENVAKIAKAGWAGLVTKTMTPALTEVLIPNLWGIEGNLGIQNCGTGGSLFNVNEVKKDTLAAKKAGLVTIASVMGFSLEQWADLTRKAEESGVDALELNISCPMFAHPEEQIEGIRHLIETVKENCSLPILPKLPANIRMGELPVMAKAVQETGATGIVSINTVYGLGGIDIETGIPLSSDIYGKAVISGVSGCITKFIGLSSIAQIAGAVKLPVMGLGGVNDWRDAVEYIMVGARSVGLCTGVLLHGFGIVRHLVKDLRKFMERKGYDSIEDFCGLSLSHIMLDRKRLNHIKPPFIPSRVNMKAVVNEEKCIGCRRCVMSCETQYRAIDFDKDRRVAKINEEKCMGCGLCLIVCPEGCISLRHD